MAKVNIKPKLQAGKTENYEGGEAFELHPEEKLLHLTGTCLFNEPKFYGEIGETEQKILDTVSQVANTEPKLLLQLASYLRSEQNLRTVPNFLLVASANQPKIKGTKLITDYAPKIINRADELTEVLAIQLEYFKKPIPNSIKKAVAKCFSKFDEYQFAKYNRKSKVTFKDAILISHAKEPSEIIKKILNDDLKTPYTWEVEISKGGDKTQTWEKLIDSNKLGYFALIRNLRNILEAKVSNEHIQKVTTTITSSEKVKNSQLFPFRFYQAYKELHEVPNVNVSKVLDALEIAMEIAFSNIPKIPGTTFIACDTSNSMEDKLSAKSKMTRKEVGLLLGVAANRFTDNSLFGCFGNDFDIYNPRKTSAIIDTVNNVHQWSGKLGCSTNGYKAIQYLSDNNIKVDRILIFTDCQLYDSEQGYSWRSSDDEMTIRKEFNKYRQNINKDCKIYLFDLSTYGKVNFPENDQSVTNISGWSENIFKFMKFMEQDPKAQLNYIRTKY